MNKAKLELPVKDFHNLYDLLGHALDHDAEAGYLDFDPEDISLLESDVKRCSAKYLKKKHSLSML